ncbi:type II toxin-antitoxin system RelE/ParE family toxin [Marinilabilia rubra]|uniref:Type II toxin-antitoxin system RelE/ParE family toxin n=1 Tax=Marinilabilia rubra TaxID=2162893 RepID=A0A2U2B9P8_9BACT|nr:hypothetical protein DDZ16_07735 [Marinilabilia rubra]
MRNTYRIIWSDEALKNLKNIIEYLERYWSEKEIENFAQLLDKHLDLLQENPLLFPKDPKYFN